MLHASSTRVCTPSGPGCCPFFRGGARATCSEIPNIVGSGAVYVQATRTRKTSEEYTVRCMVPSTATQGYGPVAAGAEGFPRRICTTRCSALGVECDESVRVAQA